MWSEMVQCVQVGTEWHCHIESQFTDGSPWIIVALILGILTGAALFRVFE